MNIFVAKLSYDTSEATVRDVFEEYGNVDSVKIIMDRETNRSKGYGFIEMPDEEEANAAISGLNDYELDGRQIVVKQAEDRKGNRGGGGFGGGRRRQGGDYRSDRGDGGYRRY